MRVINRTPWSTDHLTAFAREVARRTLDPEHKKGLTIEFRNSRSRGVAGRAYSGLVQWKRGHRLHHYGWIRYAKITLPKENPNKRALATVLEHEMLHTIGQEHSRERGNHTMSGHYNEAGLAVERLAWADQMLLERKSGGRLPAPRSTPSQT